MLHANILQLYAEIDKHHGRYLIALEEWTKTGKLTLALDMQNEIAWVRWRSGQHANAESDALRAQSSASKLGFGKAEAMALRTLGLVAFDLGNAAEARSFFEQSFAILVRVGDPNNQAAVLIHLASAQEQLGHDDQARESLQQSLSIYETTDNRIGKAVALGNIGGLFGARGEFDRALEYLERCLAVFDAISDPARQALTGKPDTCVAQAWCRAIGAWGICRSAKMPRLQCVAQHGA